MADTKLSCARRSFDQLKTELSATFPKQSEFEMVHDEEPPGLQRFKVCFDANPAGPRLRIVKEGKPNLALEPSTDEPPEVEKTSWIFDAFYDDVTFGWIKADDVEEPRSTDGVAAFVRNLL